MKDLFCPSIKSVFRIVLLLCLLFCLPLMLFGQVGKHLSNAELYRLSAQLEQEGHYSDAAEAYRIIAERDLAELENLDRAIKNYIEAQKLYSRAGDSLKMYQTVTDLGRLYCGSEYYQEAIKLFDQVKAFADRNLDTLLSARMLQQIGEVHIARGEFQEAAQFLDRASRLNLSIQDTLLSTINQLTITAITGRKANAVSAPDSFSFELNRFDSVRYKTFLPSLNLHVGMYNMHAGKYKLAMYYLSQGLKLAGNNTFVKRALYQKQVECYELMGDYPAALDVMKVYSSFSDSLNDASRTASMQETMLKYMDIERETELQEMARDRNITVLKSRMQKVLSYALLVGVVIMLIVSYIIIRSYQQRLNSNQIIARQNEEITARKINELESNRKIETISSMLQGQEVERERIARDLHDSLGGLLSTVKLHFDAIQTKVPELSDQKEYNKAYNLLDAACNEVRTISNNMQPGALLKLGIVPAIKDLVNRIESEETPHIEFLNYGTLNDLPIGVNLNIFRIVQELLYNSLKHAQAKEILIQLIRNDEDIEIMVEDDGIGFDPQQIKKGMGTENVAARVNFLHGEISIHTDKGVGTTTTITIPYSKELADKEVFSRIDPENILPKPE